MTKKYLFTLHLSQYDMSMRGYFSGFFFSESEILGSLFFLDTEYNTRQAVPKYTYLHIIIIIIMHLL